jgi:hypothetical protein
MMEIKVKIKRLDGTEECESLYSYCSKLSKRNNSVLYLLESYLHKKLLDDPELAEIRDILLTVSADISKINNLIHINRGEENERL